MAENDVEFGHADIDDTVQLLLNYYLSPSSYTPLVVSIGPLHHEDKHLKGFEVQKATYMHNLFNRVLCRLRSTPEQIIKACVTKVSGKIEQIKACYIGMQPYPDSELVKMMVTDACFILTFIYNLNEDDSSLGQNRSLRLKIIRDMLLIENQIPFFVLQDIYECTFWKFHPTVHLANFIYHIQAICNIFERRLARDNSSISPTYDHILGFLHKSYQNPDRDSSRVPEAVKPHSVVELDRSGVRFSNNLDPKWPMAIELKYSRFLCFPLSWSKPTLKMPVLRLYDETESVLRNLVIYEQSAEVQTCVTSYMYALDMLIDTPEDVAKLVKSQALANYIGSNEEAAELRHKYFSNPWSIIALIAGIVLFVLTVVQTVYSVKDSKAS
ncbi:UPF0481 protein-like protein [Tanacetum coccineum]